MQLAPVRPAGVLGDDRLEGREIGAVVEPVILVDRDIGVGAVIPRGKPDVVCGGEAHFDREGECGARAVDPAAHFGQDRDQCGAGNGILALHKAHGAAGAEDAIGAVDILPGREGTGADLVDARRQRRPRGGEPVDSLEKHIG